MAGDGGGGRGALAHPDQAIASSDRIDCILVHLVRRATARAHVEASPSDRGQGSQAGAGDTGTHSEGERAHGGCGCRGARGAPRDPARDCGTAGDAPLAGAAAAAGPGAPGGGGGGSSSRRSGSRRRSRTSSGLAPVFGALGRAEGRGGRAAEAAGGCGRRRRQRIRIGCVVYASFTRRVVYASGESHVDVGALAGSSSTNHPSPPADASKSTPHHTPHHTAGDKGGLAALGIVKLALMFAGWYLANIYFNM